jgi:hypothetical protein
MLINEVFGRISGLENGRLGNSLTFGHHQVSSDGLEIADLIIGIPNVCYQAKMKWLQER